MPPSIPVDYMRTKTKWIDCSCNTMEHAIRIHYWEEELEGVFGPVKEFYIGFKPYDYPGLDQSSVIHESSESWITNKFKNALWKWLKFKFYVKNIWWAIRGRPQWWYAEWSGSEKEAKEIISFLQECFKEEKK